MTSQRDHHLCDNLFVALLLEQGQGARRRILLVRDKHSEDSIFMIPRDHMDENYPDFAAAADRLIDWLGITLHGSAELVFQDRFHSSCNRPGGDWHAWRVYRFEAADNPVFAQTSRWEYRWTDRRTLARFAARTKEYHAAHEEIEPNRRAFLDPATVLVLEALEILHA